MVLLLYKRKCTRVVDSRPRLLFRQEEVNLEKRGDYMFLYYQPVGLGSKEAVQ